MKKIILASMIAAAAMFTACGDDDNSTSGGSGKLASCDVKVSVGGVQMAHTCMEATSSEAAKKECEEITGEETDEGITMKYEGTFGSGCPSGHKKTCTGTRNGIEVTAYFYDAMYTSMSCDQLMKDF